MRGARSERLHRTMAVAACLVLTTARVMAQDDARIAGRVVHKVSKAGISGVEVRLTPRSALLVTDSGGFFRFDRVPAGEVQLRVRRIGFSPESAYFDVHAREDLDVLIELQETVQQLDTVNVPGRAEPIVSGKLSAYYERKRFGIGSYIDGKVLDEEVHQQLGDLITSRAPGSRVVRGRMGPIAWLATTRDTGVRPAGVASLDPIDRQLGADPRACYPDVYLDGVNVYAFGFGRRLFDINSINTAEVAAIEFYVGTARIPLQYASSTSACGVLLIWMR